MDYIYLQAFTYVIGVLYIMIGIRKCGIFKRFICALTIALFITIFARFFWAIENLEKFKTGLYSVKAIFVPTIGNFKIIGVLIGALVGTFVLCLIFKKDSKNIINASIEAMFLTAGYTKLCCTIMGICCLGKDTTLPWAISYPKINLFNLHPVAMYEVITWWSCFVLLHVLKDKVKPDSSRISFAIFLYVSLRFFIFEGLYRDSVFLGSMKARIIYPTIIIICIGIIAFNSYKDKKYITKEEEKNEQV